MLLVVSLVLGIAVASLFKGEGQQTPNRQSPATPTGQSSHVASNPTRFVQDPPQRTSFRPDFSSGLRRSNQRNNFFMLRAFNEAIGESWKSTVRLTSGGQQVALGAVVSSDGWIISKASELPSSGDVTCRLFDGKDYEGKVVTQVAELDLALIRINQTQLVPITWDQTAVPERGRWLATTDVRAGVPTAVGVVSAGALSISKSNAVLGVHLDDAPEGAAITLVLPGSGAQIAGLQRNDCICNVNGQDIRGRDAFLTAVRGGMGGQILKLDVIRDGRKFSTEGRLMDLSQELLDETEMGVNGSISARSTGFARVFQHDTVLSPNQCGGPLVNLDGKAVGINIARAGRVSSYALPADVVQPLVEGLIEQAKLVSRPVEAQTTLRPIR